MHADEEVPTTGMPHSPAMEYKVDQGRPGRFIIRSCFGGADCTFVAGGSEVSAPFKSEPAMKSASPARPGQVHGSLRALLDTSTFCDASCVSPYASRLPCRTAVCTSGIAPQGTCWRSWMATQAQSTVWPGTLPTLSCLPAPPMTTQCASGLRLWRWAHQGAHWCSLHDTGALMLAHL